MDNVLLQASVVEVRQELVGLSVHRLVPHGPDTMTLLLGSGWGEGDADGERFRLYLSLLPELPLLHLSYRRTQGATQPSPFHALLDRELRGGRLRTLQKETWERVVRLDFQVRHGSGTRQRCLVAEFLGQRANLLLLDGDDKILGSARPLAGKRELQVGKQWTPPGAAGRLHPEELDPAALQALVGEGTEGLARRLSRGLRGQSMPLCSDLQRRVAAGEELWPVFRAQLDAVLQGRFEPCLYVPSEWARILRRGETPVEMQAHQEVLVSPLPVQAPPGSTEVRHIRVANALDDYRTLCLARMELEARRDSLVRPLRRELARLERLVGKLEQEGKHGVSEAQLRRWGEVLLAGLGSAQVDGDRVTVPDVYDPDGGSVTLERDPRFSLAQNAQRYFRRARKAKRAREVTGHRRQEANERLPGLRRALSDAEQMTSVPGLERLEGTLAAEGLLRLVRRQRPRRAVRRPGSAERVLPVVSYVSTDGLEVLMGRTGKENDLVTFKLAAPQDFWFHAQGFAGAHVVVRNPSRMASLPEATARQAAMLAAYHSKARGSGHVEVMMTQRRQVRKGKNQPPGRVLVRRYETLLVRPEMPFGEKGVGPS